MQLQELSTRNILKKVFWPVVRPKKFFGCPPPTTPNFWKLEKKFYRT